MSDTRKLAAFLVAAGRRSRARLNCGKKAATIGPRRLEPSASDAGTVGSGGADSCRAAKGFVRPHPCAGIERDNRLAVTRLLRELDLDADAGTAWPASDLLEPGSSTCSRRGRLNSAV